MTEDAVSPDEATHGWEKPGLTPGDYKGLKVREVGGSLVDPKTFDADRVAFVDHISAAMMRSDTSNGQMWMFALRTQEFRGSAQPPTETVMLMQPTRLAEFIADTLAAAAIVSQKIDDKACAEAAHELWSISHAVAEHARSCVKCQGGGDDSHVGQYL